MGKSKIDWCDYVVNPVVGCTPISAGCKNCYAKRMTDRFEGKEAFEHLRFFPERMEAVKHWKPGMVFVCSMSDLFHENVPDSFIDGIFDAIDKMPQHDFFILTKRVDRMYIYFKSRPLLRLSNVWLGATVENYDVAERRIPLLLSIPLYHHFLSIEPLLSDGITIIMDISQRVAPIDWVIVGGESGANARQTKKEWVTEIKDYCQEDKIPFFFKQWGEQEKGCLLDGKEYREYPQGLRTREAR